jgi:hypothetical protein
VIKSDFRQDLQTKAFILFLDVGLSGEIIAGCRRQAGLPGVVDFGSWGCLDCRG